MTVYFLVSATNISCFTLKRENVKLGNGDEIVF